MPPRKVTPGLSRCLFSRATSVLLAGIHLHCGLVTRRAQYGQEPGGRGQSYPSAGHCSLGLRHRQLRGRPSYSLPLLSSFASICPPPRPFCFCSYPHPHESFLKSNGDFYSQTQLRATNCGPRRVVVAVKRWSLKKKKLKLNFSRLKMKTKQSFKNYHTAESLL